jgi:hypothetical protein
MGVVVVGKSGTRNSVTEAPAVEVAVVEEEVEIEEIVRPEEENMVPQCVRVARKRGDEWVFYEEDHSDQAVHKLQRTVDDLMGQIKVRAMEPRSCPLNFCRNYCYYSFIVLQSTKKHRSTKNGASIQLSRPWKKTKP